MKIIKNLSNQIKKDWKELCDLIKDDKKSFKLNRFLSNNISVAVIITVTDMLFLLIFDYIINIMFHITDIMSHMNNMSEYVGLRNVSIPIGLLRRSGTVRLLYSFFLLGIVVADIYIIYNIRTSFSEKNFNFGQKGNTRWATLEEIQAQYLEIDDVGTEYDGMPGYPISRYGNKLYLDTNMTNNLIIGITRAGKGETHVFPSIDTYSRAKIKPSLIIFDMKAELYKSNQKKKTLQKRGYDVYFLNLQNPLESMGYNPLEVIIVEWEKENYTFAEDLTQTFVWQVFDPDSATGTEKYFAETGANLLAGLILGHIEDCLKKDMEINEKRLKAYKRKIANFKKLNEEEQAEVRKQYAAYIVDVLLDNNVDAIPDDISFKKSHEYRKMINMYSIVNTYFELSSQPILDEDGHPTGKNRLDEYFLRRPMGNRAKMKYMSTVAASGKTKGNIYSTMTTKLNIYTLETVAKMTAESSINILDIGFGEKPIAIYLGIPDADKSKYQIAETFIRQVYTILASKCWDGGTCKRPVKVIFDEAGNFKIEGMESIITVCAGRNITFDIYIQAFTQLDEKYGQGNAKTIRSNCGNKIFIRSDDSDSRREFSEMVGKRTIVSLQRNGSKLSLKKTFMETNEEQPLIFPENLKTLKNGEDIIVRTMKVKDNAGKDVYMAPIFNSIESGKRLLFRYEYLEDYFPTPKNISLADVIEESRKGIKLKNYIWNYEESFNLIAKENSNSVNVLKICDLSDYEMQHLIDVLEKIMDEDTKRKYGPLEDMSLENAENIIQSENDVNKLSRQMQKSLLALTNHYLARG